MATARIFCIGRNYRKHAQELNNPVPKEPVVFMKPLSALGNNSTVIPYPKHGSNLHYECEVVLQIKKSGRPNNLAEAREMIGAVAIGLDLTLRDLQWQLKDAALPWEKAKAFDDSARISDWVTVVDGDDLSKLDFECHVNETLRQQGKVSDMIFTPAEQVLYLASIWSLQEGDMIFTGTPKGVGEIVQGDELLLQSKALNLSAQFKLV